MDLKRSLSIIAFIAVNTYNYAQSQIELQSYDVAIQRKEYSSAVEIMTAILKEKSQRYADNYYKRAVAFSALGNYIYAIADCTSALNCDSNFSKAFFLRGLCKEAVGDPTYLNDIQNGGEEGLAYMKQKKLKVTNRPSQAYSNVKSDVDSNIPVAASATNKHTFVLIFANETYLEKDISSANFASNDGETFKQYCIKTLGIPDENIHMRQDATKNQMRSEIKWMQDVARVFGKQASVIVYYSGHGMPDEESRKAYLLPSDGIANDPESAYALSTFYSQLAEMDVNNVLVLLDACFSGSQRNGGMLTASKGVAIKPKAESLSGNLVVMAASQGNETAYPYEEKGHGLFTYYLLKKLQDSKGEVTLEELSDYIISNVSQTSIVANGKSQIPTVTTSATQLDSWRNIKLK